MSLRQRTGSVLGEVAELAATRKCDKYADILLSLTSLCNVQLNIPDNIYN